MDKRWLGIIIILIAGLACMYLIVETSSTVGKAVTVVKEMTITLPDGFDLKKNNDKNMVILTNKAKDNLTIKVLGLGNKSLDNFTATLKTLKGENDIEIQDTVKNSTGDIIFYKNTTEDKEYSITYFVKDNRTMELKMNKYQDWEKDWNFIIDTTVHNFKQNK